jgi:hypothetical protein
MDLSLHFSITFRVVPTSVHLTSIRFSQNIPRPILALFEVTHREEIGPSF